MLGSTGPTRTAAEALFGRRVRAAVGRWIARRHNSVFFLAEAQEAQPPKDRSSVGNELVRLVQVGMLAEHERRPGDRRRYFERTESPLWKIFVTADQVLPEE